MTSRRSYVKRRPESRGKSRRHKRPDASSKGASGLFQGLDSVAVIHAEISVSPIPADRFIRNPVSANRLLDIPIPSGTFLSDPVSPGRLLRVPVSAHRLLVVRSDHVVTIYGIHVSVNVVSVVHVAIVLRGPLRGIRPTTRILTDTMRATRPTVCRRRIRQGSLCERLCGRDLCR